MDACMHAWYKYKGMLFRWTSLEHSCAVACLRHICIASATFGALRPDTPRSGRLAVGDRASLDGACPNRGLPSPSYKNLEAGTRVRAPANRSLPCSSYKNSQAGTRVEAMDRRLLLDPGTGGGGIADVAHRQQESASSSYKNSEAGTRVRLVDRRDCRAIGVTHQQQGRPFPG